MVQKLMSETALAQVEQSPRETSLSSALTSRQPSTLSKQSVLPERWVLFCSSTCTNVRIMVKAEEFQNYFRQKIVKIIVLLGKMLELLWFPVKTVIISGEECQLYGLSGSMLDFMV